MTYPLPSCPALSILADGWTLTVDTVRVALLLREVEFERWSHGPAALVSRMRARGLTEPLRSPGSRESLASVIRVLDRLIPGGPNCYRRSLVRVALDRAAAEEPFVLGLDLPGDFAVDGPRGHAWVEKTGEPLSHFDVEFRL